MSNIVLLSYNIKSKNGEDTVKLNTEILSENNNIDSSYSTYYFMTNPIDNYFSEMMNDTRITEIELRDLQEHYFVVWKNEYDKIMSLIKDKCIYEEDIQNYNTFTNETETSFDKIKPLLLNEMLDNYTMPESPEKHSYGNGTNSKLEMYKGMIYRNACMMFIPYLANEYQFPSNEDIVQLINK